MAIRSRRSAASNDALPAMHRDSALPAFFSDRAWPGIWKWSVAVLCSAEIFSLLAAFAWRGVNGRLPDVTTVLIAVPAGIFTAVIVIAALWRVLARVPLTAGLSFLARVLPLAWLVPIADLIRSAGRGFIVLATPFDAAQYALASVTAAILPSASSVPLGIRVGIFAATLITAFVVWFTRKDIVRSVAAALVASIVLVKLCFLPSALGAWEFLLRTGRWVSGTVETQREALRAVTNGYWWTNLYDRFPSAIDAQADLAIRLTTAGIMVMALGIVAVIVFVWLLPSRRRTLAHIFRAWSALDLALYVAGAAIVTTLLSKTPVIIGTWWVACVLAVLMLAALRVHAVLERCLHHMPADGEALAPGDPSEGPVACGDLLPALASDISKLAFAYALVVAWTLGWPVFAATLAFLAAARLSRDRFWSAWSWVSTVFRAMGAAALALAGFFFVSQSARLTSIAMLVMALAAAHRIAVELMMKPRRMSP